MNVIITPRAQKHYKNLPKAEQAKVKKKISLLGQSPFAGKKLGGEYEELRTIRAWPYRVFYYIDDKQETLYITSILHRQGAYK